MASQENKSNTSSVFSLPVELPVDPKTADVIRFADEKYRELGAKNNLQKRKVPYEADGVEKIPMTQIRKKIRELLGVSRITSDMDPGNLYSTILPAFLYALNHKLALSLSAFFASKNLWELYLFIIGIDERFRVIVPENLPKSKENVRTLKNSDDFHKVLEFILDRIGKKEAEKSVKTGSSHKTHNWKFVLPNGTTPTGQIGHFLITEAQHASAKRSGKGTEAWQASLGNIGKEYSRLWEEKKEMYDRIRHEVGDLFVQNLIDQFIAGGEKKSFERTKIPNLLRNIKNIGIRKRKTFNFYKALKNYERENVEKLNLIKTKKKKWREFSPENINSVIASLKKTFSNSSGGRRNFTRKLRKVE